MLTTNPGREDTMGAGKGREWGRSQQLYENMGFLIEEDKR
jgi:hypothetical protein